MIADVDGFDKHDDSIVVSEGIRLPSAELSFRFARSGGPGGQHANKNETQVELLFDLAHTPSLSEEQRARAAAKLASYLDTEGVLHLVSRLTRSQLKNREEVVHRFVYLLRRALAPSKPRRPTQPTRASQERRVERKRRMARIKQGRGRPAVEE